MNKSSLILFTLLAITACAKKSQDKTAEIKPEISAPEISIPEIEIPSTPSPIGENSPGVIVTNVRDLRAINVVIPAIREYSPIKTHNGLFHAPKLVRFHFPSTIPVIEGRAGAGIAFITTKLAKGVSLKCIYMGDGKKTSAAYKDPARPYFFDFCVDSTVKVTLGNRLSLKKSSQNIISCHERSSSEHQLDRGDTIEVQVLEGNKNGLGRKVTTKVTAALRLNY